MVIKNHALSISQAIELIRAEFTGNIVASFYHTELGKIIVERARKFDRLQPIKVWKWNTTEPDTEYVISNRHDTEVKFYVQIGISKNMDNNVIDAMLAAAFAEMAYISITGDKYGFDGTRRDAMMYAWFSDNGGEYSFKNSLERYLRRVITGKTIMGGNPNRYAGAIVSSLLDMWSDGLSRAHDKFWQDDDKDVMKDLPGISNFWLTMFSICHNGRRHFGGKEVTKDRIEQYNEISKGYHVMPYEYIRAILCDDLPEKKTGAKDGKSSGSGADRSK